MNWYLSKIIFQIDINNGASAKQFEESYRLILAPNVPEALHESRRIGKLNETQFLNNRQEMVCWKFIDVADIIPVESPSHGTELFARTFEEESPPAYSRHIRRKAEMILAPEINSILASA